MPPKTRRQAQAEAEAQEPVQHQVPATENEDENPDADEYDWSELVSCLTKASNFTSNDEEISGILTTVVEIEPVPRYGGWISRLEASFKFPIGRSERYVKANAAGRLQFVPELLERDTLNEDDPTDELRSVCRLLYTGRGTVRQELRPHRQALLQKRLVFIDTFKLEDKYRGIGLSGPALGSFHDLIRQFLEVRTVILSPARGEGSNWGELTDLEVERRLVRMYERNNYEIWIQGDEDVEGSITVMGQMLNKWDD